MYAHASARLALGTRPLTCSVAVLNVDAEDAQGNTQLGVNVDLAKRAYDATLEAFREGAGGCDIKGSLHVHKVAGNFRIALGRAQMHHHDGHSHTVYQFNVNDLQHFNSSHVIRRLAFGPDFPGMHNGLDGVTKTVTGGEWPRGAGPGVRAS